MTHTFRHPKHYKNLKSDMRKWIEEADREKKFPEDDRFEKPKPKDIEEQKKELRIGNHLKRQWNIADEPKQKDGRFINKTLNKFENRTDNPDAVAFNPTTQLFTNEKRTVAFKDYNVADKYNKSIGVKNTKYYQDQATPEQVGALAERLERSRQMTGSDGRYDKPKPVIKKKKISTPIEPVKIDYKPFIPLERPARDPQMIAQERRFKQIQDQAIQEKINRNTSGLAGLMGGIKNDL